MWANFLNKKIILISILLWHFCSLHIILSICIKLGLGSIPDHAKTISAHSDRYHRKNETDNSLVVGALPWVRTEHMPHSKNYRQMKSVQHYSSLRGDGACCVYLSVAHYSTVAVPNLTHSIGSPHLPQCFSRSAAVNSKQLSSRSWKKEDYLTVNAALLCCCYCRSWQQQRPPGSRCPIRSSLRKHHFLGGGGALFSKHSLLSFSSDSFNQED